MGSGSVSQLPVGLVLNAASFVTLFCTSHTQTHTRNSMLYNPIKCLQNISTVHQTYLDLDIWLIEHDGLLCLMVIYGLLVNRED